MIELVAARVQADFQVGQTLTVGYLSEGHRQELLPTRETQNLVVTAVTDDTTAELLGMNPGHDLSEDVFSNMHFESLAGNLLREMPKSRSNRSHLFPAPSSLFGTGSSRSYSPWPDDSDIKWLVERPLDGLADRSQDNHSCLTMGG